MDFLFLQSYDTQASSKKTYMRDGLIKEPVKQLDNEKAENSELKLDLEKKEFIIFQSIHSKMVYLTTWPFCHCVTFSSLQDTCHLWTTRAYHTDLRYHFPLKMILSTNVSIT